MWLIYALLSAVFAALTAILAKIGIDSVNSNNSHGGSIGNGVGCSFLDERTSGNFNNHAEKLDIFNFVGTCYGGVVAFLL